MATDPAPRPPLLSRGALLDRRQVLRAAGAGFLAGLSPRGALALERTDALFAAACRRADGSFGAAVFAEDGRVVASVALPERGHDVAFDARTRRAVAFARRPETFALVFDTASGAPVHMIDAEPGRHFFGHGFFSPDGRLLYATENDFDANRGLVGVYDVAAGYRRIGEFDAHGMDTHEALLMPDGETIVLANGGIETHPDFGRQKLNLATMEPSLVFIDRRTGDLVERHVLPAVLHQLSIRHLAVDGAGGVWFGCQYEGPAADAPQLLGVARPGRDLALAALPREDLAGLSNYVGSVAASADGARIALASPVGGSILVVDASSGAVVARRALRDGCGLAPAGAGFLATSGHGDVVGLGLGAEAAGKSGVEWDNHVLAL